MMKNKGSGFRGQGSGKKEVRKRGSGEERIKKKKTWRLGVLVAKFL
jgi:hypothetical protein